MGYQFQVYLDFHEHFAISSTHHKFFEFLQARLAVAIGPSVCMSPLVEEFKCGFVSKEFTIDSMADMLNSIDHESLIEARLGSHMAARELCWEQEKRKMEKILINLLPGLQVQDY